MSDEAEYVGKTFKSGNSVALRLPKGLGLPEGTEVRILREGRMTFRVEPVEAPRRTIDISGFAGKLPGFKPAPREDFEERPSAVARRKALSGE
ncbi:antitoxin VapB [Sphingobium xanthum]|jgi:antitoxin VapB|uniref:AbrB/MazE/SpoVT family DNA-binding domain-containing protein n=1 Tax=Sphingobium xanthum TaxID=1387165 RepID=UPI001C8CCE08|nr:AbrB/MazE/SpoVT family DNA-binding domain-containing protein [Sphingobium xanthum]